MKKTVLQNSIDNLTKEVTKVQTIDWFEHVYNNARGLGNTDMLIRACKQENATLICATIQQAEAISAQHKINTVAVNNAKFALAPCKSAADNYAIYQLIGKAQRLRVFSENLLAILAQKNIN